MVRPGSNNRARRGGGPPRGRGSPAPARGRGQSNPYEQKFNTPAQNVTSQSSTGSGLITKPTGIKIELKKETEPGSLAQFSALQESQKAEKATPVKPVSKSQAAEPPIKQETGSSKTTPIKIKPILKKDTPANPSPSPASKATPRQETPQSSSILSESASQISTPPIKSILKKGSLNVEPEATKDGQAMNFEDSGLNGSKADKEDSSELKENEPMDQEDEEAEDGSKKRKKASPGGKAKKKQKGNQVQSPKTPVMKLNEMKPGLVYNVESQTGPPHKPVFTVSVEVDGQKYSGDGCSKQEAKHSAALSVLSSFIQFQNQTEISQMMPVERMDDFTSDTITEASKGFKALKRQAPMNYSSAEIGSTPKRSKIMKALAEFESKSPVMLLNELHPGVEYAVEQTSTIATHRFTMSVTVGTQSFEGTGSNKKLAKAAAARSALIIMYQIPFGGGPALQRNPELFPASFPQAVANKISRAVYDRFVEVVEGFDENKKFKVLSGIVMTKDEEMEDVTVVAVTTGTKSISGDRISMNGASLNDCHAEIISRRCFKDFIYNQLEMHQENEDSSGSVLEKLDTGGYRLKPNVKFHLYISTAPCGDARIFSPHELVFNDGIDKHPNRKGRGVLRTKIEAGEGTIPVKPTEAVQTWDGIQGGQRLLTMSCSDKITRWNVLGLQGSLLSLFVEPIYLESIILGNMYHEEHMYRAVGKRIELNLSPLPLPYKLQIPKLCLVSNIEIRQPTKSPNFCINWTQGLSQPEIVTGTTGKKSDGEVSRLSKRAFFQRFHNLLGNVTLLNNKDCKVQPHILYAEAKCLVNDYKEAKEAVLNAFKDANLGSWVTKPPEQDEFEL